MKSKADKKESIRKQILAAASIYSIKTLAELVRDGIISIGEAAKRAKVSVAEFSEETGIQTAH